jgi:hypothetical protein
LIFVKNCGNQEGTALPGEPGAHRDGKSGCNEIDFHTAFLDIEAAKI